MAEVETPVVVDDPVEVVLLVDAHAVQELLICDECGQV